MVIQLVFPIIVILVIIVLRLWAPVVTNNLQAIFQGGGEGKARCDLLCSGYVIFCLRDQIAKFFEI